jgi:hypothetical protein
MAALSTAHRAALTALVDQCPDAVLTRLVRVVPQMGGGERAGELMAILEEAMRNRRRRAVAFSPLLPLFQPREDGVEGLTFPRVLLGRLWSAGVQGQEAHLPLLDERDGSADRVADRLCRAAAGALRDRPEQIWPTGLTPETRERDLAELAGCLDLVPLARQAARQLPDWLKAGGDDRTDLRLLLKDAAAVAPDGATRLIEILFAHLAEAPAILRIVTRSSAAAAREEFLEGSELADFVARIVRAVRVRTEGAVFDPDGGEEAVAATVDGLRWAADALTQIDISLETDPAGDWSREIGVVRRGLTARTAGRREEQPPGPGFRDPAGPCRGATGGGPCRLPVGAARAGGHLRLRGRPQVPSGGGDQRTFGLGRRGDSRRQRRRRPGRGRGAGADRARGRRAGRAGGGGCRPDRAAATGGGRRASGRGALRLRPPGCDAGPFPSVARLV